MSMDNTALTKSAFGTIVMINFSFLHAAAFAYLAWVIWPEDMRGYGWGFLAIISWLVAFASFARAIKGIIKLYQRDKMLAMYLQQGAKPKSSTLASDDALKKAGMR